MSSGIHSRRRKMHPVGERKKKEEIDDEAIVVPIAPAKKVAFDILQENCNGFTLEPGVAGKEKCKVEVQFEKPMEPPEGKGKENAVAVHPKSLAENEYEYSPFVGKW